MSHVTDKTLQEALVEALLSWWSSLWSIWVSSGFCVSKADVVVGASWDSKATRVMEKHPSGEPTSVIGLLITFLFDCRGAPGTARATLQSMYMVSMFSLHALPFEDLLYYLCLPGHLGSVLILAIDHHSPENGMADLTFGINGGYAG